MTAQVVEWDEGATPIGPAVAAIGVFDGVHAGHQALIADTVAIARESGVQAAVITFDRDPEQVVKPDAHVPQLLHLKDKLDQIASLGVDAVIVVPFCVRLAAMTPPRFLDDVLLTAIEPRTILVGRDFRFGVHASGTVETLAKFGEREGFAVKPHDLVEIDGVPVTATRIRGLIAQGEVGQARKLLTRPHSITGAVVHGRGEGKKLLGIPTANVTPWAHAAIPEDGVYAGWVRCESGRYAAAISVGKPPMYPEAIDEIEAHLLDFEGDIYGQEVIIEFARRIRGQELFEGIDELGAAIRRDIEQVREVVGNDLQ